MNFRFTWWKTVLSIIIGYGISYLITSVVFGGLNLMFGLTYNIGLYGLWIVFAIAIYCIWSAMQKVYVRK